jgi:hypothetical protein
VQPACARASTVPGGRRAAIGVFAMRRPMTKGIALAQPASEGYVSAVPPEPSGGTALSLRL